MVQVSQLLTFKGAHCIFRFTVAVIFALGLALFGGRAEAAENPELVAMVMRKKIALDVIQTRDNDCDVSYTLQVEDFKDFPPRLTYPFWAVSPPAGTATIQMVSAEWIVLKADGSVDGPYLIDQKTPWGVLPPVQSMVRTTPQDEFRTVTLQRAEVQVSSGITRTTTENKTESATAIVTKALLKITIAPAAGDISPALDLATDDPYLKQMLDILVVNKSQIPLCPRSPKGLANEADLATWNQMLTDAEKRAPLLMAHLPRGGVYKLDAAMLREAGASPETLLVSRIRIFVGKDELPFLENDVQNDRLMGNASILFYVPIDVTDKKPFLPLWIIQGAESTVPRRVNEETFRQSDRPPVAVQGTIFKRIFEPVLFNHEQPLTAPMLKWATADIPSSGHSNFEIDLANVDTSRETKLTAWISGTDPTKINESYFDLLVNGNSISKGDVRTGRVDAKEIRFPSNLFHEGVNQFTVACPEQDKAEKSSPLRFVMAELSIPITSDGLTPQTVFTLSSDEVTSETAIFRKQLNFAKSGFVVNVTDPLNPVFSDMRPLNKPAQFGAYVESTGSNTSLIMVPIETLMIPSNMTVVKAPKSYTDKSKVDYLSIYFADLLPQLQPLLDHRAKDRTVASYTTDDVYAAYSYGELRYQAIRDCIYHAFQSRQTPRLREVLLVGEGSEYWWEYRRDSKGVSRNMVPVFGWQDPAVRIRGDESYALLTGTGPIADVEISRISVNNGEELGIVVNKIINYDENPPTGEWRNRHLFVTDDEPDFIQVCKSIIQKTFTAPNIPDILKLQDYPYEDYFRGIWRKRSAEFTDKVIDEIGKGALTVTYLGHGGPNLWSSERILHIRDIDRMVDQGRHAFLLAGSCDTGWVDYPIEPVKTSLSEHFIRRENGGMVGAFIPIDGTSSYEHDYLLSAFFKHLMQKDSRSFGQLCLLAKLDYYLDRNNSAVTNQYLLMGDTACMLPAQIVDLTAQVEPKALLSATGRVLRITGKTSGYDMAAGHAYVLDKTNIPIAEQRFTVRGGDVDTTISIPAYLSPGAYSVVVETSNDSAGKSQTAVLPVTVQAASVSLQWSSIPASELVQSAGRPVQFHFSVKNDTDIDLRNAEIVVEDVNTRKEITRVPVSIMARETTSPAFEENLLPGITQYRGRLIVKSDDPSIPDTVLAESTVTMRAQSSNVRYIDFPLDAFEATRLPGDKGTRFRIPIYNMTEFQLPHLAAVLKMTTDTESIPIGEEQSLDPLEPAAFTTLEFQSPDIYAAKPVNFMLELYDLSKDRRRLLQLTPFTYQLKSGPDLAILPGDVVLENENVFGGKTVYIRITVTNVGDEVARSVTTAAYLNEPWIDVNLVPNARSWYPTEVFQELYPGEKHTFRLRWDPKGSSGGTEKLFGTARCADSPGDVNLSNNVLAKEVTLLSSPNLRIDESRIVVSKKYLKAYDRITVRAPFSNSSTQDFIRDFRFSVYAVKNDGSRNRIFSRRFNELKAGEDVVTQFDWIVQPGEFELAFNLNEDREYLEQTYDDNVSMMTFPYLLADTEFGYQSDTWSFSEFPDYGTTLGVTRTIDGGLMPSLRPQPLSQVIAFDSQYLTSGTLGYRFDEDNLWGCDDGHLRLNFTETAQPVRFHFPLPTDSGTRLYDIYFDTIGDYIPEKMSGDFKYRIEDQTNWTAETRPDIGKIYMGRFDVKDNFLDIEFGAADYGSYVELSGIYAVPVVGVYESPWVELSRPLVATFVVSAETPGTSHIRYEVRYSSIVHDEIQNGTDWQEVQPGGDIPPAPPGGKVIQWRASLFDAADARPRLNSVEFKLRSTTAVARRTHDATPAPGGGR